MLIVLSILLEQVSYVSPSKIKAAFLEELAISI